MSAARHLHAVTGGGADLSVFADLRVETDGQRLHLVGDGRSLVLHSSHPRRLISVVRRLPLPVGITTGGDRRAMGRLANMLRDNDIAVAVRGPEGTVVNLGKGADSVFGRLVTGSPAVAFGTPLDLAVAVGLPVRAISVGAISGLVVAAVVLLGRTVRRSRSRP